MEQINYEASRNSSLQSLLPPPTGTSQVNVGKAERIVSLAGGAILTTLGFRKLTPLNLLLAAAGGALLFRGATGFCPVNSLIGRNSATAEDSTALIIQASLLIRKPKFDVYHFWRHLENLPTFMDHLAAVQQLDGKYSYWEASFPGSFGTLHWEAEIVEDIPGEKLTWRSVQGSMIQNAGEVVFRDAASEWGTELECRIVYRPPVGYLGKSVAKILTPSLEKLICDDIGRVREVLENTEVFTNP